MTKRESMTFFETFVQKQNDNLFFRDPKRRLITRKVISRNANIRKTWNKQGMRMTQGGKEQELQH